MVTCPKTWDQSLAVDENLTHLPMVFDGNSCFLTKLCENVQYSHVGAIVPSFKFSLRARNREWAELYDSLSGYVCDQGGFNANMKRVTVNPGEKINPKRFRKESAWDPNKRTVPVSDKWDVLYNCLLGHE
ncbi:hypothetical protein AVEN_266532-1 [Araneus ventricosus]|uniref:Uncharacterized protein n=1 Tax=Araneus ventricosus TaxID=182803 RepID=A0A4Y2MS95_ARAVE|nr:hypothetical protein AVEN_266532-1 [Araneus ventricosus]